MKEMLTQKYNKMNQTCVLSQNVTKESYKKTCKSKEVNNKEAKDPYNNYDYLLKYCQPTSQASLTQCLFSVTVSMAGLL